MFKKEGGKLNTHTPTHTHIITIHNYYPMGAAWMVSGGSVLTDISHTASCVCTSADVCFSTALSHLHTH